MADIAKSTRMTHSGSRLRRAHLAHSMRQIALRGLPGGLAYRSDDRLHPATSREIQSRILNMHHWTTSSAAFPSD
jgi:hypothetical protein